MYWIGMCEVNTHRVEVKTNHATVIKCVALEELQEFTAPVVPSSATLYASLMMGTDLFRMCCRPADSLKLHLADAQTIL
jgi:hypothetical protein